MSRPTCFGERFFYRYDDMAARGGMSGASFSISLQGAAAKLAAATPRSPEVEEELLARLMRHLPRYKESVGRFAFRMLWLGDSWLPHAFTVPGEACEMGAGSPTSLAMAAAAGEVVRYSPHNVDSRDQAYELLVFWGVWAEMFELFVLEPAEEAAAAAGEGRP